MNANIWVRSPYPFRSDEWLTLEATLQSMYGKSLVYFREFPVDRVSIDNTNISTCKLIAANLKMMHRHYASLDQRYRGTSYCTELEVVIQKSDEEKPAWAKNEVR
jgi:hypothetical protein